MKTKNQVIEESWGEFWDRLTEFQKEHAFSYNGSVQIGYSPDQKKLYKDICKSKLFDQQPTRPKSLKGIVNNNGWLIVDTDNLPKEGVYTMGRFLKDGTFYISTTPINYDDLPHYFWGYDYTHYRPIFEIPNPIY